MSRVDHHPAPKWTVLIVDDDPCLQALFSALLARDEFAVDSARNGREAFDHLRRGSYSVILLDLMMPEVNGFELLERLERDSPILLRRVIVMTGASQHVVDVVDPARVWGVIRKPFDIHELIRLARICAAGRPRFEVRETRIEQRA